MDIAINLLFAYLIQVSIHSLIALMYFNIKIDTNSEEK